VRSAKLVAADARDHVAGLGVLGQNLADALECGISRCVAMHVIELVQVVGVREYERERPA
jgi:hypothetical protein